MYLLDNFSSKSFVNGDQFLTESYADLLEKSAVLTAP
jgi:hypothetical protein